MAKKSRKFTYVIHMGAGSSPSAIWRTTRSTTSRVPTARPLAGRLQHQQRAEILKEQEPWPKKPNA